jgi:hypothetical protein
VSPVKRRVLPSLLVLFVCAAASTGAETPKPPANLFANSDFERGREEWRLDKSGKTDARFSVEKSDAPGGGYCAAISIDSVEDWGTQFGQTMAAGAKGKTFTFAVLARAAKGPITLSLEIERAGQPYDRAARSEKFTLTDAAWKELHVTFKVDKDFPEGWFAYTSCVQPNAAYRVARVRLYEGEYVPYEKAAREEAAAVSVAVFDTGAASAAPLAGDAVSKKTGWTRVPEEKTAHVFKGDAVMCNDRLTVVLRRSGPGAEVYANSAGGPVLRTVLAPAAGAAARLESVAVAKNAANSSAIDATFKSAAGTTAGLRYELEMGQVFVKTEARAGTAALAVEAPARFAILPDFFADDIIVDAAEIPVNVAELPSENFLLHMVGGGDAIVMAVSADRDRDFTARLSGQGAQRVITSSEIPYGKTGRTWVAVLEAPGVWHQRDVAKAETGNIVRMDWRMPYPAQWRMDWHKTDNLIDSWEMVAQRPSGEFEKPGVFGSPSMIPANRKRWTTVLGSFLYPCRIDQAGQGYMQPLKSDVVRFEGPALIYPINRVKATPLATYTVADIMRGTLGLGPCEYILDVEGQGSAYKGRATCAARDALRPIYNAKQQRQKRAEIEKVLDEVMVFVRHIRGRIDNYVDFGHKTIAYLEQEKKAHPELSAFAAETEKLARAIDAYVEKRKDEIKTVPYTQAMVDEFRKTMLDYEGEDAPAKCKKFTEDLVVIGGNQDELAGECRMAVKILRQRAGLAMAADPRVADAAKEIRRRAQEVLRNPAGHEGARH